MTLSQLALTIALLAALGLIAGRFGLSAIPAYLLAGLLLGPHEPHVTSLIEPSEVTTFVAELGIIFLLFFLGLEFTVDRLLRSGRHIGLGGSIDLTVNAAVGLLVGVIAFGFGFPALILAAAIYVSSSAVTVKGLIDFRRLADDETDLILAILVFEDIVIAGVLGFAAAGGEGVSPTLVAVAKALVFVTVSVAASRFARRPIDALLGRLPGEFMLLVTFGFLIGMAAIAKELGLSEAIGALMAGVVLAETSIREEIEERFLSFRDVFAALFFFVFGLSIDVGRARQRRLARRARGRAHRPGQARERVRRGRRRRVQPAPEPERRRRPRRPRRVHDHPGPDRIRQRRDLVRRPQRLRRLRRPLRPRDGHARRHPHEGVEANRPPPLPASTSLKGHPWPRS